MLQSAGAHPLFETRYLPRDSRLSRIRVAVVFRSQPFETIRAYDMSVIRWTRISEALSYTGLKVDVIVEGPADVLEISPNLRLVPATRARWDDYDVVKTLFHKGFQALKKYGGADHPMIIAKFGSVVGIDEREPGVYFFGDEHRVLLEVQREIARSARYITVLTESSRDLWIRDFDPASEPLLVPTGVDGDIPPAGPNPYGSCDEKIAVFVGNIYVDSQPEVNALWQRRLNELGKALRARGVRLFVVGKGRTDQLDPAWVSYVGPVDHHRVWDYQYHADVGVVLAQGAVQHNESSKIYYYLRSGLPVVSEAPVPNNHVIVDANLGYIVPFSDTPTFAERVEAAARQDWDRDAAMAHVLSHHTWAHRAAIYERLIRRDFALQATG